jgi:hypothetical protein
MAAPVPDNCVIYLRPGSAGGGTTLEGQLRAATARVDRYFGGAITLEERHPADPGWSGPGERGVVDDRDGD